MKKTVLNGEFKPIVMMFSKRNQRFQCLFQECGSDRIYPMNVSGIETASETEKTFDYDAAEQILNDFWKKNKVSVKLEFYDVKNLADRILTEFSPWEKQCLYNQETKRYELTIFYQKREEKDLVVRLLGYGDVLSFTDKKHPICEEMISRLAVQKKQMKENPQPQQGSIAVKGDR